MKMDHLQAGGMDPTHTRRVLSNTLVLVTPGRRKPASNRPADLRATWCKRLALAQPLRPRGHLCRTFLRTQGLWGNCPAT